MDILEVLTQEVKAIFSQVVSDASNLRLETLWETFWGKTAQTA